MSLSSSQIALEARSVTKRYGAVPALDGVSLTVPRGACVAVVGESGSGKTTLLRTFNRMVDPDGGSVWVDGHDVAFLDPVQLRRSIGYVQQEGGLLPHWTVLRNAALVPWLASASDAADRARTALELVGLPSETFGRYPSELSGGQRQRAALARALAGDRTTLLLDEPFSALDAITRVGVQRTFARVRAELGLTVLLVTHDLREAFELAATVVVMKGGGIDQVGTPRELERAPASPYVTELLDKAGVL